MKKKYFLKAATKNSGLLQKKIIFMILSISSISLGNETEIPSLPAYSTEKLTEFNADLLFQQSAPSSDTQLPPPIFDSRPLKSSFLTTSLSALIPGFGHLYLGDMKTAGSLVGITGLSVGGSYYQPSRHVSLLTAQNTWFYGIYAAYRDVRIYNKQAGYSHQMPMDSFSDLSSAPFTFSILKKPEVWGGLLGKFVLASTFAYLAHHREAHGHSSHSFKRRTEPLIAFPVGIGEEAFFRGFLQSRLSETFNPWIGITLSSLLFGAAHIANGQNIEPENRRHFYSFAIPFITLGGFYYGWLTHKNHSLKESVALHTWYDFILITLGSFAGEAILTGHSNVTIGIPF